ncbi:hypothetical protein M3B11_10705 [Brevibacterium sp. p3-SID960]|nr:hypothetical protein [Brevibacterium sp. p3-SID960]MCT1691413.1 hypothetical protein [Brevibacterium sp. p3-SID960]
MTGAEQRAVSPPQVSTILHHLFASDPHSVNARRCTRRVIEGREVAEIFGVEDDEVGTSARRDTAAVWQGEDVCSQRSVALTLLMSSLRGTMVP